MGGRPHTGEGLGDWRQTGRLAARAPAARAVQLQAGRDLLAAGFPDDAARQLRVIDERFADPGRAPVLLARAEFARRHYVEAYAAAGRALARMPGDSEAASHHVLGVVRDADIRRAYGDLSSC